MQKQSFSERVINSCCFGASSADEALRLIVKVCCELTIDRGYGEISVACVHGAVQAGTPVIIGRSEDGAYLHIFFHGEDRVGVKFMRSLDEKYSSGDIEVVVVSIEGPTTCTKKETLELRPWVQMLTFNDVFINVTKHCLVHKHRRMDPEEIASLRSRFGLSEKNQELPKLSSTDPVAKYYRFRKNDIIEISRPTGFYYRQVV